ncbi:hypothetical protein [Microbulbifer epialgicus]|uniref:DUF3619 family protein n=1 Tax=Microbulbifer epialgicus TaxID=393907 RepID=A0ABV4NX45_9GAMM
MKQPNQLLRRQDQQVVVAVRVAVARREDGIDGETLSQLRRARSAALQQSVMPPDRSRHSWLLGLGGACAALLVLLLWPGSGDTGREELLTVGDWLLYEEVDVEMIEDMEFYQWLAEELDGRSS